MIYFCLLILNLIIAEINYKNGGYRFAMISYLGAGIAFAKLL